MGHISLPTALVPLLWTFNRPDGYWLVPAAMLLSGLAQLNWQLSELLRQYLIAVGLLQEFHTLSDFYTHIKGVEYIIAVLFLGAFPAFYTYLNRPKEELAIKT